MPRPDVTKQQLLFDLIFFARRFLMLHMAQLTLLTMFLVAVLTPSALNAIYLLIVVVCAPTRHGTDNIGFLAMLYTQARPLQSRELR